MTQVREWVTDRGWWWCEGGLDTSETCGGVVVGDDIIFYGIRNLSPVNSKFKPETVKGRDLKL